MRTKIVGLVVVVTVASCFICLVMCMGSRYQMNQNPRPDEIEDGIGELSDYIKNPTRDKSLFFLTLFARIHETSDAKCRERFMVKTEDVLFSIETEGVDLYKRRNRLLMFGRLVGDYIHGMPVNEIKYYSTILRFLGSVHGMRMSAEKDSRNLENVSDSKEYHVIMKECDLYLRVFSEKFERAFNEARLPPDQCEEIRREFERLLSRPIRTTEQIEADRVRRAEEFRRRQGSAGDVKVETEGL